MAFRPLREFVLNFLEAITSSRKLLREENSSDPNSLSPCGLQRGGSNANCNRVW